jgi:hypothetical protein
VVSQGERSKRSAGDKRVATTEVRQCGVTETGGLRGEPRFFRRHWVAVGHYSVVIGVVNMDALTPVGIGCKVFKRTEEVMLIAGLKPVTSLYSVQHSTGDSLYTTHKRDDVVAICCL